MQASKQLPFELGQLLSFLCSGNTTLQDYPQAYMTATTVSYPDGVNDLTAPAMLSHLSSEGYRREAIDVICGLTACDPKKRWTLQQTQAAIADLVAISKASCGCVLSVLCCAATPDTCIVARLQPRVDVTEPSIFTGIVWDREMRTLPDGALTEPVAPARVPTASMLLGSAPSQSRLWQPLSPRSQLVTGLSQGVVAVNDEVFCSCPLEHGGIVVKSLASGEFRRFLNAGGAVSNPQAICLVAETAAAPSPDLIVVDAASASIAQVNTAGNGRVVFSHPWQTLAAIPDADSPLPVRALACTARYVAACQGRYVRILRYSATGYAPLLSLDAGAVAAAAGAAHAGPFIASSVAIDGIQKLFYVTEASAAAIGVFSADGVLLRALTGAGTLTKPGVLALPHHKSRRAPHLFVANDRTLVVLDTATDIVISSDRTGKLFGYPTCVVSGMCVYEAPSETQLFVCFADQQSCIVLA